MSIFSRLIAPGDGRKTRLRNARDIPVSMSRLLRNGPRAAASFLRFKLTGGRPKLPWISYDGIVALDTFLRPDMAVLEYGSGMSTLWFAERVASVVSVDDSAEWIDFQRQGMVKRGIANVTLVHASTKEAYIRPAGGPFDFILIDGRYRDACAEQALQLLKPGGAIYLDNSDVTRFNDLDGNLDDARDILTSRAKSTETFVDFVPTVLWVSTGKLFRF